MLARSELRGIERQSRRVDFTFAIFATLVVRFVVARLWKVMRKVPVITPRVRSN